MRPAAGIAIGRGRLPLLAANTVSLIGSSLTLVALPWFVLQTTGSAARTGLTGFAVALPVYARQVLGSATDLGLMVSAFGLGALAGVALYGAIGHRLSRRALWFGAYLLSPGFYWALAARPAFPALLVILVLLGLASGPINPLTVTIRHERIPPALRGRVFATYSAVGRVAEPLGMVLGGVAIAGLGLRPALDVFAAVYQAAALGMFAVPALRRMDARA